MGHIGGCTRGEQLALSYTRATDGAEMQADLQDVLRVLRYELNYLQQSGYPAPRDEESGGPPAMESPFLGNHSCLNFGDTLRSHACRECVLSMFVPEKHRTEDIPCHFIPLGGGETIEDLLRTGDRARLVLALEDWLRITIARLEAQMDKPVKSA